MPLARTGAHPQQRPLTSRHVFVPPASSFKESFKKPITVLHCSPPRPITAR